MAVHTEKQAHWDSDIQKRGRGDPDIQKRGRGDPDIQKRAHWGPGILRLAGWLPLAAAALVVWPLAVVTAAGLAVARLRGWPASRLGRQAGWTLPMTAVWIAAESARGWRALTLNPVRDGSSGWPHLTWLTVIRTFLLVAPVTIPAGLAFAALLWAWRTSPGVSR